MTYYIATEDGSHFTVFEETELIFDALVAYYEAINDGTEGIYIEIEMGYKLIDEDGDCYTYEMLEIHSFVTDDTTTNRDS